MCLCIVTTYLLFCTSDQWTKYIHKKSYHFKGQNMWRWNKNKNPSNKYMSSIMASINLYVRFMKTWKHKYVLCLYVSNQEELQFINNNQNKQLTNSRQIILIKIMKWDCKQLSD